MVMICSFCNCCMIVGSSHLTSIPAELTYTTRSDTHFEQGFNFSSMLILEGVQITIFLNKERSTIVSFHMYDASAAVSYMFMYVLLSSPPHVLDSTLTVHRLVLPLGTMLK